MEEQLKQLKSENNIKILKVGRWLWVTGNTYPIKEQLKELGFFYSKNKKSWFFNGEESKKGRGFYSFDELKDKFGVSEYE